LERASPRTIQNRRIKMRTCATTTHWFLCAQPLSCSIPHTTCFSTLSPWGHSIPTWQDMYSQALRLSGNPGSNKKLQGYC
jgi:hypothetical protein